MSAGGSGAKCEKLTKINILHIAINYIRSMENLLETGESGVASFKEMTRNPIRDDKNRKLEVQRVLEALMKRSDTSRPNPGENIMGMVSSISGDTVTPMDNPETVRIDHYCFLLKRIHYSNSCLHYRGSVQINSRLGIEKKFHQSFKVS